MATEFHAGVPVKMRPLDFDAVEIGDEPVIVAHLQQQRGQPLQGSAVTVNGMRI